MNHEYVLGVMVVAYALHIVEEHNLDWKGWVKRNAHFDVPIGVWAYYGAYLDGVLTTSVVLWSIFLGALIMAFPLALWRLKANPCEGLKNLRKVGT